MGKLIYLITTSLDGYVDDKNGNFDWTAPSEESHTFVNDVVRNTGTFLFGHNMYEVMKVWDTMPTADDSEATNDFARIWRGANKIVYSTTLTDVDSANTTIEQSFDATTIQKLVADSDKDFGIGGPHLAAEAIRANIIDEYHQIIAPVILDGSNHWLPKDVKNNLTLVGVHKFNNGFVHLHYCK